NKVYVEKFVSLEKHVSARVFVKVLPTSNDYNASLLGLYFQNGKLFIIVRRSGYTYSFSYHYKDEYGSSTGPIKDINVNTWYQVEVWTEDATNFKVFINNKQEKTINPFNRCLGNFEKFRAGSAPTGIPSSSWNYKYLIDCIALADNYIGKLADPPCLEKSGKEGLKLPSSPQFSGPFINLVLKQGFFTDSSLVIAPLQYCLDFLTFYEELRTFGVKKVLLGQIGTSVESQDKIFPILFSTSFETGDLSRFDKINFANGTIEVIPNASYQGNYGLKIYAGYSTPYVRKKIKSNPLWLRVYFRHGSSYSWDETFHWINIYSESGKSLLGIRHKVSKISVGWRDGAFWDLVNTNVSIPLSSWMKLELGIKVGSGDGWIEVWKDDQLVYRKTKLNNASYGEPALISLEVAGKSGDFDPTGFYDCVAVSNERIINAGIPAPPERTSSEFIHLLGEIVNPKWRTYKEILQFLVCLEKRLKIHPSEILQLVLSPRLISRKILLEPNILIREVKENA
ncbi:hypothetical protein DRH14_03690, partial [Candidatus Shapirobacteria bacterium]